MYWLKTNIGKIEMDELYISNKLLEFRKQQPNFKDIPLQPFVHIVKMQL